MRRREAIAAVVAGAAAAPLVARPAVARAQDGREIEVLSLALRLEHTTVFACDAVADAGVLSGAALRRLRRVRAHEAEHAAALARMIGSLQATPPDPPRGTDELEIPQVRVALEALRDRAGALELLADLERMSIEAHRAGIGRLREGRHIQLLATILGAEAAHLVAWGAVG